MGVAKPIFVTRHRNRVAPRRALELVCLLLSYAPSHAIGRDEVRSGRDDASRANVVRRDAADDATDKASPAFDPLLSTIVFDDVWRTIRERYYDPGLRGVDWNELRTELRPLAARATTRAELYRVLRRVTGALRDSHTRVLPPGEARDWRAREYTDAGVTLTSADGDLFVAYADAAARRAGVRAGSRVLNIDGRAWSESLSEREREAGASTARANRLRAVRRLLDGEPGTHVELTIADERGRVRVARLARVARRRTTNLRVRSPDSNVHVVAFDAFTSETIAEFARLIRTRFRAADALVIDLRANGGGEAEAMIDLLSVFLPPDVPLGRFVDREGRTTIELRTRSALLSAPERGVRFKGELVVLTSAATASAAEIFADVLQKRIRARVIGETTCGCVLALRRPHALPDGGTLDLSELDYRDAEDRPLEGAGVAPGEVIRPTRADLAAERDPALARARRILSARPER